LELTTKRSNFWYILPLVLGLLGGIIAYFVLRKSDSKKAKICLIIGIGISAVWTGAIASSSTSEINSKVPTVEKNKETVENIEKPSKADYEILDSKRNIEINKEYQSDIWSYLSLFREDSSKEEILKDKISNLKKVIGGNIEEIEYSKEDLTSATSQYEKSSISSWIQYLQNIVEYDKQKLKDLENKGLSALEEYAQNELEKANNEQLERIQRLENLKSKNLNYLNTDEEVLQYISNYRGIDNKGNTLLSELESFIEEKYGYDALTNSNPMYKDNWAKASTGFYFGTQTADMFSSITERYKVTHYAFFYPLQGEYKTVFSFDFDSETYDIVAEGEPSQSILNKLDNS